MKVLVLRAGVVGVASAYYLNKLGCDVTVVNCQAAVAAETSFANGGQISVSNAEPWANPSAPLKVLRWLALEDAPLLFRLRPDARQWLWGLAFLRECTPARTRSNIEQVVRLGTYSRARLHELRHDTGISYDQLTSGILHFNTDAGEFHAALAPAEQLRALGCERRVNTAMEAVAIEPALSHVAASLAGVTYTTADEFGDAHQFTTELERHCAAQGVDFLFRHDIKTLHRSGGAIDHVEAADPSGRFVQLRADAYVLAAGSFSVLLAAPLGLRLYIYPAKGFSISLPVADASRAYRVSLTDDEFKLVFARFGDRLRIAGTAELNGYERGLNRVRCAAIVRRVEALFPRCRGCYAGRILGNHAVECALHRPQLRSEPISECGPWHARLDPRLWLRPCAGRPHLRQATGPRFPFRHALDTRSLTYAARYH